MDGSITSAADDHRQARASGGAAETSAVGDLKAVEGSTELAGSIAEQFAGLAFGSILITVHNGRVVQLERTEKTRY